MSITEQLQRMIAASRTAPAQLNISDKAAKEFAGELEQLQLMPITTHADIYAGLLSGTSRFMDIPVVVAAPDPDAD